MYDHMHVCEYTHTHTQTKYWSEYYIIEWKSILFVYFIYLKMNKMCYLFEGSLQKKIYKN